MDAQLPRPELETLADLAKRSQMSYSALRHAALVIRADPAARAGPIKFFDRATADRILEHLATGQRRSSVTA
jgi:hypothetical protein